MARPRVELVRGGVQGLLQDVGVRAYLADLADKVQSEAVATAPVETGNYRDSIGRVSTTTDRAVERVVATAPHAHLVEARTGNLAAALSAIGMGDPLKRRVWYTTKDGRRIRATQAQVNNWTRGRR